MSLDESPVPPNNPSFVVAIDGPAGAGKSTIARHLARHFGLLNLETGAMYRAFALKALRAEIPLDDSAALEHLAAETAITLEPGEEENRVLLDGEDVTGQIRNQTVTDAASRVSVFPSIRASMVRRQQEMGAHGGVVMEGRDIGTVGVSQCGSKDIPRCCAGGARACAGTNRLVRSATPGQPPSATAGGSYPRSASSR